jgi:ATP-dependent protease ClpP protease subunit
MNITYKKRKFNNVSDKDDDDEGGAMDILGQLGGGKLDINRMGNKIYFYEEIHKDTILELIKQIQLLTYELELQSSKYGFEPHIDLHIYSPGGDAFMGLSIYDFIKNNNIPIYTYIDGNIASAATFMFLAGEKRFMSPNSTVLIHQVSTSFWGKFEDLKDEVKNTTEIMKIVRNLYSENTTMKKKDIDAILKRELFLNYMECEKVGFITSVN